VSRATIDGTNDVNGGHGVAIVDSDVEIRDSRIDNSNESGVHTDTDAGSTTVTLRDTSIDNTRDDGVETHGSSIVTLNNVTISRTDDDGVDASDESDVTLNRVDISTQNGYGLLVRENANADGVDNTVADDGAGVCAWQDAATGTVEINGNQEPGGPGCL
jgi:hypothetical protein